LLYKISYLIEEVNCTVDLLVLTNLDQLLFIIKILFKCFIKQAALLRRLTVLSLPLQLVFPATSIHYSTIKPESSSSSRPISEEFSATSPSCPPRTPGADVINLFCCCH
jgi:hypothetical protein